MHRDNSEKLLIIKPDYYAWPISWAYVLTCLESNNIPFDFIDVTRSPNWTKDVTAMLRKNNYLAVASGGLIGFYSFFQQLASLIRKHDPNLPYILGGNITKDASDSFLFDRIGMDFGVLGEAETAFPGLIIGILQGYEHFSELPGIIYKDFMGNIIRNHPQRLDMRKENVLPAWNRIDVDYYIGIGSIPCLGHNIRFMPVLSGRGCTGNCAFCSPTIGRFRKRPVEHLIQEINHITSKYDFDYVLFYNEMFYPTVKEIRAFCRQYGALDDRKPWIPEFRVDSNIDVGTFGQMKEAGCLQVVAGIESGSDKILKLMNKRTTPKQIRSFFRNAKMANMPTSGTFMLGYEGETEEDIRKTIDLVIEEEINTAESPLYIYPGTAVYRSACEKGFIKGEFEHLEKATKYPGIFIPDWDGKNEPFFNITDMSDDQYRNVAASEVRRYHTFVFNRYPVRDLSCRLETKRNAVSMVMAGRCHECGAEVGYSYNIFEGLEYKGMLGAGVHNRLVCRKCITRLSFNIYTCPEMRDFSEHFDFLKERISKKKRIIVGGINEDAMFLLRIDLLNLDYKKVLGFMDFTGRYKGEFYVNHPVLNIDQALDLDPDCILLVDYISDIQGILSKLYGKRNIPEILYLCDRQFRDNLLGIRLKLSYRIWNRSAALISFLRSGGGGTDVVKKRYGREAVKGEYK